LKISEKAALAMAGYTKAEIEAMDKPAPTAPAAVQNPAIPQQVPPLAAPPAKQITPQPAQQPSGQYDGLEALLQQILQGQQSTTQAMQTMTQAMQANALGLGIQQQPAVDASTVTARIIDPTYGQEVK
jgi:ABC-type glycerol-3-phosphate transport system substrate-binding protein